MFFTDQTLAMETELEQEGNENAWRTADLRIRKTQVPLLLSLLVLSIPALSFPFIDVVLSAMLFTCLYLPLFQKWKMTKNKPSVEHQLNLASKNLR